MGDWYILTKDRKLVSYSNDLKFLNELMETFREEDAKKNEKHKYKITKEK